MTTLIILGDSWACGEWHENKKNQFTVAHHGLNQYLVSHFDLINLSRGGASNWQTYLSLSNYLEVNFPMLEKNDYQRRSEYNVVIIQSDPGRAIDADKCNVYYDKIIKECQSLRDLYTQLTEIFYAKCQDLAEKFSVNIHMCGGLSDLDSEIMCLYKNLLPLCPSWIKLLDTQHQPDIIPLRMLPELFVAAKHHARVDICKEIIEHSDQKFPVLQHMLKSNYFGPDPGDNHPSRQGHEVLSNFIKSTLGNVK